MSHSWGRWIRPGALRIPLRALRDLTRRHSIVLIVDEIQSGFGRTGRMFAYPARRHRAGSGDGGQVSRRSPAPQRCGHGRDDGRAGAEAAWAEPMVATRSPARRRWPYSTSLRANGSSTRAQRLARNCVPGSCCCSSACPRLATCAAWGRCSRSSWSRIARRRRRMPRWRSRCSSARSRAA